ncbi:MAG: hypothetical protein RL033_619 [Pseudomonadota bacterium]
MPPSRRSAAPQRDASLLSAEQLLREPPRESAVPPGESPRSLSNEALLASLRPTTDHGGRASRGLRRSMEPHLIDGASWFMQRAAWQRALLSTSLGALVGVGIVVTFARLFPPDESPAVAAAPAAIGLTELAPPAAEPPELAAEPVAPPPSALLAVSQLGSAASEATPPVADVDAEATPHKSKRAQLAAAKRSKRAKQHRARKAAALPARWSELYARDR